ncbi:unnamed protein product [Ostreobium quekettii]|uniref:Fe2OG dioxygenase domain-containing protein n=1 Tax=Ostreobium quekettii TaxID=121088 RepID=A0A8S1IP81_9CHLO|nr:unnamed protein product [Ostreobium quekettii]|eukprot:evm.model.scf_444.3 EVM.evm.TU.scf_444.3   scf_444:23836-25433(+)
MASAPVIDVGPLLLDADADAAAVESAVAQVGAACREWGFFQAVGHGVPDALLARFNAQARAFFSAPASVKRAVFRSADNPRGYFDDELTKRRRDWKEGFDYGGPEGNPVDGENRWPDPDALPRFRETLTQYFDAMVGLASALTAAVARSLGLDPGALAGALGRRHASLLRLNHYPECPNPEGNLGVSPHKDVGMLTLLLQDDVGGLQVEHGGEWVDIPPIEGAYVVNVGDMMQVFSNDAICSPVHRVVPPREGSRYSAPFFYNPAHDTVCEPIASVADPKATVLYRPFTWAEFIGKRLAGNLEDLGEEVQIAHYRVQSAPGTQASELRSQQVC